MQRKEPFPCCKCFRTRTISLVFRHWESEKQEDTQRNTIVFFWHPAAVIEPQDTQTHLGAIIEPEDTQRRTRLQRSRQSSLLSEVVYKEGWDVSEINSQRRLRSIDRRCELYAPTSKLKKRGITMQCCNLSPSFLFCLRGALFSKFPPC